MAELIPSFIKNVIKELQDIMWTEKTKLTVDSSAKKPIQNPLTKLGEWNRKMKTTVNILRNPRTQDKLKSMDLASAFDEQINQRYDSKDHCYSQGKRFN